MEKIASFTIDHTKLLRGIYVSRKDYVGDNVITTFDIRIKQPNKQPVLNTAELHTFEHLIATYLRNDPKWAPKTIYTGPMGCRTGMYVLFAGDYESKDIVPVITKAFEFVLNFEGEIPGATAKDCGYYLDHDLNMAKYEAKAYLEEVLYNIKEENLVYPE